MKVTCKQCRRPIPGDDINIKAMAAKCVDCGIVFGIDHPEPGDGASAERVRRPPVDMPPGVRVHRPQKAPRADGDPYRTSGAPETADVILECPWWNKRYQGLLVFTFCWCAIVVLWYVICIAAGARAGFLMFGLIHASVGVFFLYYSAALLRNRTRVALRGERLSVEFSPMPWFGAKTLPVRDIVQFYTTEGVPYTVNGEPMPGFSLHALDRRGNKIRVVKNLPALDIALYVEQELEAALGIVDEPVPDEVPR